MKLQKEKSARVIEIRNDPYSPNYFVWIDAMIGNEFIRLLVPQNKIREKNISKGQVFTWIVWKSAFLDAFLNDVQDITEDFPRNLDHLLPTS